MRILIATRVPHRFRVWRSFLEQEEYEVVVTLPEHREMRRALNGMAPGVVLLDLSEADCQVGEFRRWLNQQCPNRSVGLMAVAPWQTLPALTAEDVDDIVALAAAPEELLCRLRRVLRLRSRAAGHAARRTLQVATTQEIEAAIVLGELTLRPIREVALVAGHPVALRRREFDLLQFLATHPNRVFRREDLIPRVWGSAYTGSPRTVDTHIRRLRHRLGAFGRRHLQTVRGVGYRLAHPEGETRGQEPF